MTQFQSQQTAKSPDTIASERQRLRLEQLLTVCRRLCDAIGSDIAALEKGSFGDLKTADPEIERLCSFYAREVKALKAEGGVKRVPAPLLAALRTSGAQLDELLKKHERLVTVVRQAAEGLVQAVAEGVEMERNGAAPYAPPAQVKRAASSGAIVYNKVV